ncbi:cytochrome P450 [uncultured Enterovirga sp.]|uniref:cytochrome P450 n=1 Tax=uncultured Enterovirga sp. TaxID=2026352 RepID=UPI0035CB4F80
MRPPAEYGAWGRAERIFEVTQWNGSRAWFVTRFDDIKTLLRDPRLSADAAHPNYPAQTAALALVRRDYQVFAQMDPPEHTAERKLLAGEFSARAVEQLRPKVQAMVDARIDEIAAKKGEADLVQDFAAPLPCQVICTLLGVPASDHAAIQRWALGISTRAMSHEDAAAMIKTFCDGYLTDLVEEKDRNPQDDLLSRLIVNHVRSGTLTKHKVVSLARLLLTAGHESTTGTLGVGLAALLYHPEQLDKLRRDPDLIKGAVEEILRYTDVTHSGRLRTAKEDIDFAGVTIRAGEAIIMHQPTANREEGVFDRPHDFDITREITQHLTFGTGIHNCIGQPLARMELQIGIGTLVARLPDLRPKLPLGRLEFHGQLAIYGLNSLPVVW